MQAGQAKIDILVPTGYWKQATILIDRFWLASCSTVRKRVLNMTQRKAD